MNDELDTNLDTGIASTPSLSLTHFIMIGPSHVLTLTRR